MQAMNHLLLEIRKQVELTAALVYWLGADKEKSTPHLSYILKKLGPAPSVNTAVVCLGPACPMKFWGILHARFISKFSPSIQISVFQVILIINPFDFMLGMVLILYNIHIE